MTVEKAGEKFSGYNKPKRTPNHPKKSHAVLAKEGDKVRLIFLGLWILASTAHTLLAKTDKPYLVAFFG